MLLRKVIDDITGDVRKFIISTSIINRLLDSIEMISDVWRTVASTPLKEKTFFICIFSQITCHFYFRRQNNELPNGNSHFMSMIRKACESWLTNNCGHMD